MLMLLYGHEHLRFARLLIPVLVHLFLDLFRCSTFLLFVVLAFEEALLFCMFSGSICLSSSFSVALAFFLPALYCYL